MKRTAFVVLSLMLCIVMFMNACNFESDGNTDSNNTDGNTGTTAEEELTTAPPEQIVHPIIQPPFFEYCVENDFYGFEEKIYDDASFSFIEENGTRILKGERAAFSDDAALSETGTVWDTDAQEWSVRKLSTGRRAYTINLNQKVTKGDLIVKFQFQRNGGKNQGYGVKLAGTMGSSVVVWIENDSLTIEGAEVKIDTALNYKTDIPAGEWYDIQIKYSFLSKGLVIAAFITDEYGNALASASSQPLTNVKNVEVTGIQLIDSNILNFADFGLSAPEYPTSVWYIKNFIVKNGTMKTGDTVKIAPKTIITNPQTNTKANFLSIGGGENTIRSYYGMYTLLPDKSGFICGTADQSFYLYKFATQELVYLDTSVGDSSHALQTYVNPVTGNVFYRQYNDEGCQVLCSINPKTLEKKRLYEATGQKHHIGIEVTNDEKYTFIRLSTNWTYDGRGIDFGRLDLEKGEIDAQTTVSLDSFANPANKSQVFQHPIINPVYPNMFIFGLNDMSLCTDGVNDQIVNVMTWNSDTGEFKTFDNNGYGLGHVMWNADGTITCNDYTNGSYVQLVDKDFNRLKTWPQTLANHAVVDGTKTWCFSHDHGGIYLKNIITEKGYYIHQTVFVGVSWIKLHPYHPHTEISADGEILTWGMIDESGVLGVAWMTNPDYPNS